MNIETLLYLLLIIFIAYCVGIILTGLYLIRYKVYSWWKHREFDEVGGRVLIFSAFWPVYWMYRFIQGVSK